MGEPTVQFKSAPPFTSCWSYQLAKRAPFAPPVIEGCHCMAVPVSLFSLIGVLQVTPKSVERA